jgi:trehalose 2-sulfotransferase
MDPPALPFPMTPVSRRYLLLCATHRTGSNLLEQYLKASAVAGKPKEFYSPDLSRELAAKFQFPDPDQAFLSYQAAVMAKWHTANGVFAAKIMWRHLESIRARFLADPAAAGRPSGDCPWETLLELMPEPMVVHVTRRDKVQQAISMVRAKQTGLYTTVHLDRGRKPGLQPGDYDFHAIKLHVDKLTAEDAAWVNLFQRHRTPVQTVVFEDFVKAPQDHTAQLLTSLGLPQPSAWSLPAVAARPQSDGISAEWRQRFLEDLERGGPGLDPERERRHRARKALERKAARHARWERWQHHVPGRWLMALEKWWIRNEPEVRPDEARGDGVKRPDLSGNG